MEIDLKRLNSFLGNAAKNTYAGGADKVDPQTSNFQELEYEDGDWYYRDSYAGFFRSWGREVIWFKGAPIWNQLYGGGMEDNFSKDADFARQTFSFLKKAMSVGEKENNFQPRGPENFKDGDWEYLSNLEGNISNFKGSEKIIYKGKVVFTHKFFGGLIKDK